MAKEFYDYNNVFYRREWREERTGNCWHGQVLNCNDIYRIMYLYSIFFSLSYSIVRSLRVNAESTFNECNNKEILVKFRTTSVLKC